MPFWRRTFPKLPPKKEDAAVMQPPQTPPQLPDLVCPTEGTCAQCPMWDLIEVFDDNMKSIPARNNRGLRVGQCRAEYPRFISLPNGDTYSHPPMLENAWCYPGKVIMEQMREADKASSNPAQSEPVRKYSELS